jgi:hypothetical protein
LARLHVTRWSHFYFGSTPQTTLPTELDCFYGLFGKTTPHNGQKEWKDQNALYLLVHYLLPTWSATTGFHPRLAHTPLLVAACLSSAAEWPSSAVTPLRRRTAPPGNRMHLLGGCTLLARVNLASSRDGTIGMGWSWVKPLFLAPFHTEPMWEHVLSSSLGEAVWFYIVWLYLI